MKKDKHDMLTSLSSGPVQQLLADLDKSDIHKIILKHREMLGIPVSQLADQLQSRKKAKDKLPLYFRTPGVVFPAPENLEQSSSQATAAFKAELVRRHWRDEKRKSVDLTGGFGVDAYYLSTVSSELHFVEPDAQLLKLSRHNHGLLGADNVMYYPVGATEFLQTTNELFDLVYLDPSRRTAQKRKVFTLEDASPNIAELKDEILMRTKLMLIKASPLLDIQAGITRISNVKKVYVVAVDNECKELLFWCEPEYSGEVLVEALDLDSDGAVRSQFSFSLSEEKDADVTLGEPSTYLYEPNAAILKAGAFKSVANRFGLVKVHPNTHLYTADKPVEKFPGRSFLVEAFIKGQPREMAEHFPEGQANVVTRNYPLSAEALKKKTHLRDGGNKFLLGFSGRTRKYLVVARRL